MLDVAIRFCPTTVMVAEFFTKPLQGNTFRQFRKLIAGRNRTTSVAVGQHLLDCLHLFGCPLILRDLFL
jgi:hypothetical protein